MNRLLKIQDVVHPLHISGASLRSGWHVAGQTPQELWPRLRTLQNNDIAYFGDPQFVGWGGGIPLWRNGQVVGSIAVSGLSSEEDIDLAMLGADLVEGS